MLRKLFVFAVIAQPFDMLAFGFGLVPLNILWTLLLAVLAIAMQGRGHTAAAVVVALLGGALVDYHPQPARSGHSALALGVLRVLSVASHGAGHRASPQGLAGFVR